MRKIKIEIPDSCEQCPCHTIATENLNNTIYTFHICKAFYRILAADINHLEAIQGYHRCLDCLAAELPEE